MSSLSQYFTMQDVVAITSGIETLQFGPYDFTQKSGETTRVQIGTTHLDALRYPGSAGSHYASCPFVFPKKWNGGEVRFRVFWATTNTDTGNVMWQNYCQPVADGEVIPAPSGPGEKLVDTAQGTTSMIHMSPWSAWFTLPGTPVPDDYVINYVTRAPDDALDTYTGDADLLRLEVQFNSNTPTDD